MYIPILLGTNRKDNNSGNVADFVLQELEKRVETKLFTAEDFNLPTNDYGQSLKDQFSEYRDSIVKADGLIIVTPEYNHGYPGILKSILDLLLKEYTHKPVALVTVSAGGWGGTRVAENLVPVLRELGLMTSPVDLNFSKVQDTDFSDEQLLQRTDRFIHELLWLSNTLKWGRENSNGSYRD